MRVALPAHLRDLAGVTGEVEVEVPEPATLEGVLDALESRYPTLRGTMRDQVTRKRRPFVRFFVGEEDWSHEAADAPLPDDVASGKDRFSVVGAMAGG